MDLLRIELIDESPPALRLAGEIDMATAGQLAAALGQALAAHANVVVDMAEVTFIDAAGLRAIVEAAESLDGRAPLILVNARRVARLLDLVGLSGLATIAIRDGGDHANGC